MYLIDLPCPRHCPRVLHKMEYSVSKCPQCESYDPKSFEVWLTTDLTHVKLLDMTSTPSNHISDDSKRVLAPKNELLLRALGVRR